MVYMGFAGSSVVKNPPTNARDMGLTPGSGRSPGLGNGNPLHCSCLGHSTNREVWRAAVYGATESQIRLSTSVVVVQALSCVQLFATPWTAARQVSLSFTNSWSLLKLMSIESVMPSNHLVLCSAHPRMSLFCLYS